MIAVRQDASADTPRLIQRPCQADREPLHAARQRHLIGRFHQKMHVSGHHGIVHDPETRPCAASRLERRAQRRPDGRMRLPGPQAAHALTHTQRDMDRVARHQHRPGAMRHTGSHPGWLATGPTARAAVRPDDETELPFSPTHLELAYIPF